MKDYYKIGRIKMLVARAAHIQSADIYVNATALRHIYAMHGMELEKLGYSPLQYVKYVAAEFNQLWQAKNGRVLVVVKTNKADSMVMELVKVSNKDKGRWEICTACRRNHEYFKNKKLLWYGEPTHP